MASRADLETTVRFHPDRNSRMEQLVQSMLRGLCVPFLGAGMSCDADPPHYRMRTSTLEGKLREVIASLAAQSQVLPDHLLANSRCSETRLSALAEIIWHHFGLEPAVEAIQLQGWLDVEPTNGHRYLAFLAREFLITEILTTNYDCLVEDALTGSKAPVVPSRTWPEPAYHIIRSLDEYRRYGATRSDGRNVLLHVLKLNGCAREFAEAWEHRTRENDRYRRAVQAIAVTERQLQDFRTSAWSEQMFRDRVRTRRLLFVGFGSEDPMVRHTIMQVSEEFSDQASRTAEGSSNSYPCYPACHIANAPFVAALDKLTPSQRQVLAGFCLAHCGRHHRNRGEEWKAERGIECNACAEEFGDGQTADAFWREIYVRAVRRLWLERYFSDDSPLAHYLAPLLHSSDNVLAAVRDALIGGSGQQDSDSCRQFWQRFELYASLGDSCPSPMTQVHCAAAGVSEAIGPGKYVAFADEPIGLPMLYLLWVLLGNAVRVGAESDDSILPLELPAQLPAPGLSGACIGPLREGTEGRQPRRVWCRLGDPGVDLGQRLEGGAEEGNHVLLITLDGRHRRPRRILRSATHIHGGSAGWQVRPQTVFVVPDALLLSQAASEYRRSGLGGLLRRLHELLVDPEQLREEGSSWEDYCEPA